MQIPNQRKMTWMSIFCYLLALVFIWILHGAVPFIALPTLGQAVWATGFSQSFARESIFSIHALNIGLPYPAAISFGLAVAYPAGLLIAVGIHAADAYTIIVLLYLTLSFWGAWRIALWFRLSRYMAVLASVLWLSMPIIWAHAGYSMLSIGIALLPFYFWSALNLIYLQPQKKADRIRSVIIYFFSCLCAVFMDGYSFMMFAVGSGLLLAYIYFRLRAKRRYLLHFALWVHVIVFLLSYLCYANYIGKPQFNPTAMKAFRGWGADLTFFAEPSFGIHWMWDILGLSVFRSDQRFFGDPSVWMTTFCLPLIIVGVVAWWRGRSQNAIMTGFLLLFLFGFYMSLGPSIKINSTRPEKMIMTGQLNRNMPADLAIAPSGTAWIYKNIPGFKNMRATYRWTALGIFSLWVLILSMFTHMKWKLKGWQILLLALLILSNLPHINRSWKQAVSNRNSFLLIDKELINKMDKFISPGEVIAFLPYRNDFLVNYIAPRINIRTYNIGGDKNLFEAQKHWPVSMKQFQMGVVDASFIDKLLLLLIRREADAVVLPYIDLLNAAYTWPPPIDFKKELEPIVEILRNSEYLTVKERQYFAVIRISTQYLEKSYQETLEERFLTAEKKMSYPLKSFNLIWALSKGWYRIGDHHVWSQACSEINFLLPDKCKNVMCSAVLKFSVFAASANRPTAVRFTKEGGSVCNKTIIVQTSDDQLMTVPIKWSKGFQHIKIEVPNATSPYKLGLSEDRRTLGIALKSIDIKAE